MTGRGKRVIDGRPETLKRTCEESLRRLQTNVIDLYYRHRWDQTVRLEESMGAMADMVAEGNIRAVGLSEISASTVRRARTVHPIAAVQTDYSLWTRKPEIGAAVVAFSSLARAFWRGVRWIRKILPSGISGATCLAPRSRIFLGIGCC